MTRISATLIFLACALLPACAEQPPPPPVDGETVAAAVQIAQERADLPRPSRGRKSRLELLASRR